MSSSNPDQSTKPAAKPNAHTVLLKKLTREAISKLHDAREIYNENEDDLSDLPPAFVEVAKTLQLAEDALTAIRSYVSDRKPASDKDVDKNAEKKEKGAAEKVQAKAARLRELFNDVVPPGDGPRAARYQNKAGRGGRIELLMKEILEATIALAKPPAAFGKFIADLDEALKAVSKIPPSLNDDNGHSFHNYGSGPQSIHLGEGNQNINAGSGNMFNGTFGDFHIPSPKP